MKRFLCAALAAVCLASSISLGVLAVEMPEVSALCAVLYDPAIGAAILEKNAHERRAMASTTKIMTAILALELYDIDMQVEILPEWCGVEGSSFYLQPGEIVTVSDLLYGLLLASGNDAARALACIFSGDESDFVDLMNKKARALGLVDTAFANPSGLSDGNHYSTAYEMAVLAAYALKNQTFADIVATRSTERAGRYLTNHNKLLSTLEGAVGVKTGYTKAAGRCLVSACERQGRTLIAVTLSAPDDWRDHEYLYNHGFANASEKTILSSGLIGAAALVNTSKSYASLGIREGLTLTLSDAQLECINIRLYGPRIHYGSVREGEPWGRAAVFFDGKLIFETPVFFAESVGELPPEGGWLTRLFNRMLERFR